MLLNGKEVDFPAICKTSFFKVIEHLEKQAEDHDKNVAVFAQNLLKETEQYPLLKEGFDNIELVQEYEEPIHKLCRTLFPDALLTNEIKAATPPFFFTPIYASSRFKKIMKGKEADFLYKLKDVEANTFYLYACYSILSSYYGYPIKAGGPMMMEIEDKRKGIKRSYRMAFNADLIEFIPTEKSIEITEKDYKELIDNFENIALWKEKFPPNSWIMRGIGIINLMDVTVDQSLSSITSNLLIKSKDSFARIQQGVKNLFGNSDIEVGLVTFGENELIPIPKSEVSSILLGGNVTLDCSDKMCQYTFRQLVDNKQPIIISDVEKYNQYSKTAISVQLVSLNIQSYIIAPLIYEDELLGFLELASKQKYELNAVSLSIIEDVIPVLAMAAKRLKTETQNQIEAIIQQECTTIHPAVKWRFEVEAQKFLMNKLNNEESVFRDIKFREVYPLYGQLDIRNSSVRRNEAVKHDLITQLNTIGKILKTALRDTNVLAYEELIFRVNDYVKEIKKGLSAGDEHKILDFLRSDIYPVFRHLKDIDEKLRVMVANYDRLLDPGSGTIYEERKKYDNSVNTLNNRLSAYLDQKQEEAQRVFPHYFERYKTDGVEYNIYIGQSISNTMKFDPIYLQNLRLWQLMVMCELENEFKQLQSVLETHVDVASLILVYNTPLAVHFRMDEKRFDVEGAYNARYEIIKKRVDKAHIKGTSERITQPGKIAIIYSQDTDAVDYKKYLKFLYAKGYIYKGVEDLDLEDLQGITGLKALRVKINYASFDENHGGVSVDELMESIHGNAN